MAGNGDGQTHYYGDGCDAAHGRTDTEAIIKDAIDNWWGSKDPRPTLEQAIARALLAHGKLAIGKLAD